MKRLNSWAMLTKDTDCEVEHEVFLTWAKSKAWANMLVYSILSWSNILKSLPLTLIKGCLFKKTRILKLIEQM